MPMRFMRLLVSALALVIFVAGLSTRLGPLPPLGHLLDPVHGVWAVARSAKPVAMTRAAIPGLDAEVRVLVDRRGVPHIFATTEADAYRAQGYIVARDRLFQLELQTRATAGRLTEWVDSVALSADRAMRALDLAGYADRHFAELDTRGQEAQALRAFADGVNAWIDRMRARDLPFEYRLLDVRPERWRPANTFYLLQRMNWTLAYGQHGLKRQRVAVHVGGLAADALLSSQSPIQEPIQPNGQDEPRFEVAPIPPPIVSNRVASITDFPSAAPPLDGGLGSNNWAVAPERTLRGHAILAGDPHLELTLPSIWYEIHLVVPGIMDVYGATIPGAPGIIIGFNRDVAWSFTNTEADVMDFYREIVDDSSQPRSTQLDGEWVPVRERVEEYHDPRGQLIAADTFLTSHRGPLRLIDGDWLSLRWTAFEPSHTMGAMVEAARAKSAPEWLEAMERFDVPPQNTLVADRAGTIAIRSTGRFPLRPGNQGGRIVDGSASRNDWMGSWPVERMPFAVNPAQGYLASANQQPIDPAVDSTYLGADWRQPWRALRINQLLRRGMAWTPDAIAELQTDAGSARADHFVPVFLAAVDRLKQNNAVDPELRNAGRRLAEWDRRYGLDSERAILFELAMDELTVRTWDELENEAGRRIYTPSSAALTALLQDSVSLWWDDQRTAVRETRDSILAQSLRGALQSATERYGDPEEGGWRWSRVRTMRIYHLLRIPALSALDVPNEGGTATLSPMSAGGTHGASWRMVVELAPEVRGWTVYPGGQSGNPASAFYDDRIPQWSAGALEPVSFPSAPNDLAPDSVVARLVITPTRQ
ncbi:MAG: penicillin acylase family protein [Gemmatimonadales bacterium]|nr:penicillin acylase family protein [Gemmatimonadales bacterium]